MPGYIMKFTDYRGQDISMVPRKYLIWIQGHLLDEGKPEWMSDKERDEFAEAIKMDLAQRDRSHDNF